MRRVGTHQPPSGQYPHSDRQTLSIGRFAITMPTSRPKKVKNVWLGMGERYRTLAEVFEHDTNDLFKRIGVNRGKYLVTLSGVARASPSLSETRVQPPPYSAARIGTVVHRAIPRLFENCLPFEGGKRMPLHGSSE